MARALMLLLGKRCPMSIHYFYIRLRSCRLPRRGLAITVVAAIAISLFCDQFGTYTVQPLGAVPEGATYVVRRIKGEPFFNSIDGTCDRWGEDVTTSCRGRAIRQAPLHRILIELPYQQAAYLLSVQAHTYARRSLQPDTGRCGDEDAASQ
jgi:hypothetical protein